MGIAGSHPHIYHQSMSGSKKYRLFRHGVPNKYSLSAHLSYKPYAEEKFFPPPILHTKFHELNLNSSVISIFSTTDMNQMLKQNPALKNDNKGKKYSPFREIPETSACKRKKFTFPVSRSFSRRKAASQKDTRKQKIRASVLSTSSVSSGVDSVSEDSEVDIEKMDEKEEHRNEEISLKCESKICELVNKSSAETDSHIPRCSLDSGASFDEEDSRNSIFDDSSACKHFETVFEEKERSDGSPMTYKLQGMYSRKKSSSKCKKTRKFSLVKSFRKMSRRAISSSAHQSSSSKSKFLFSEFPLYSLNITKKVHF